MFTALQFLSCGQRRKGLSKPVFRVTVQAARKIGNASSLRWRTCRWKQVGDVSDHSFSHRVAWNIWKQHFQRVTESKWNGAETAQNKRKTCKRSFGTYLGAGGPGFESPHSDHLTQKNRLKRRFFCVFCSIFVAWTIAVRLCISPPPFCHRTISKKEGNIYYFITLCQPLLSFVQRHEKMA